MRVELINTGTEILLGEIFNTHAYWIGNELAPLGLRLSKQTTIADGPEIGELFRDRFPVVDVLIVTGGLGPTLDDLTRESLAEVLGVEMHRDESVVYDIEERFRRSNYTMSENNYRQAMVPEGAKVLKNPNGTAPGLYMPPVAFEGKKSPHVFLLPGPPNELYPMFEKEVSPVLADIFVQDKNRETISLSLHGYGESQLAEILDEELLKLEDVELGYRLGQGFINVRLIGPKDSLLKGREIVLDKVGDSVFSDSGESMGEVVVNLLAGKGKKLVLAESCTGGAVASLVTDVTGASQVFLGSFVTYANDLKVEVLGISRELINEKGAVSGEVAKEMAEGALVRSEADYAISLTGIAGPTGGTEEKPVGTVFIGLSVKGSETVVGKYLFTGDRDRFKLRAKHQALDILRKEILGL